MDTHALLHEKKLMRVSVYRVESELGLIELHENGESAFGLKLRCLVRREIMSACEEAAAIQVYRETVAVHRQRRLRELNAPRVIIASEMDPKQIAAKLVPTSLLDGFVFLLDNMTEVWIITVDWDDTSNDCDVQDWESWPNDISDRGW